MEMRLVTLFESSPRMDQRNDKWTNGPSLSQSLKFAIFIKKSSNHEIRGKYQDLCDLEFELVFVLGLVFLTDGLIERSV